MRIRRPVVIVGGELTLDMLDLQVQPESKFYEAPIQLKANGGVFLVDDFGRQRMRPEELLNRWIVPLESRVDFLTLHTGKKFQVPFDVLIVFATNLDPETLVDEAFLRRIPYKIRSRIRRVEQFTRIFELVLPARGLQFHHVMVAYLQRRHYPPVRPGACARASRATFSIRSRRSAATEASEPVDHARAARHGVPRVLRGRGAHPAGTWRRIPSPVSGRGGVRSRS